MHGGWAGLASGVQRLRTLGGGPAGQPADAVPNCCYTASMFRRISHSASHPSYRHLAVPAGRLPFAGKDKPEIKRNITANNLAPLPSFLTPQCQSFIKAMLTYSVDQRPSCAQLLQHPYITMYCTPPVPKPAALPNVIALHAYSPGAGGPGEAGTWAGRA